ncbi:MAG TPA: sigma 54-interacting transcriptional regulator [Candidatus Deferrimicrobiaceae bacterium]|nr:sigma 54-interacting transcriptional regulator [Candidatus Deferrimicrobiaceae bacterium]
MKRPKKNDPSHVPEIPSDGILSLEGLAESEHRFRKLVEALPDAILLHTEGKIVFVNPFCVRLLGAQGPEQLLGKDITEIINPEYLPAIRRRILDCLSSGTATPPMEAILIACDGSSVEIEAVAIPISWNGAPAIEVVARDIRKRKQAEREAQKWQKRLELAGEAGLRIGLWDWDVDANTVIWSDETYRQFGYTRDTFSGRVEDALARIHPEDRPRVEAAIQKVLMGGLEYAAQYRVVRRDGTTCWIDAHGVVLHDGSTHLLGIGIDITSQKRTEQSLHESEEKYLLLLNSTAEGIYGLDLQGNCTFCNPACLRLLGYQAPEDLLGRNMHVVMHHTRVDGTPCPQRECKIYVAIWEGRPSHVTDEVFWRADGTSFPAEYWSYPMRKGGEIIGSVVTFLDISDRQRAEKALRQSEQKYRELENDKLATEKLYLEDEIRSELHFGEIVGETAALKQVLNQARIVAPSDATVLILGETGTGKELVARAIHRMSSRQNASFIKLNCAAIPTGLLESELFGHEKGAFTGAISQKIGRLELADKGTLFLDEVGEIPSEIQPKLLRVLQDQEFERLGSTRTITVNIRLISATNRDLAQSLASRQFRSDLYYRLCVFPIRMPALRERKEDIPLLVRYFVQEFARRMKKQIETIPTEAMNALVGWTWPGNVRELENFLERSVILSRGPILNIPLLELSVTSQDSDNDDTLENLQRETIVRVLRETRGVLSGPQGAAARLGMKRTTLQSRMQKLGISREEYKNQQRDKESEN